MAIGRRRPVVDARKAGSVEAALRRALRAAVAGDRPAAETWLERIVEADSADLDAYLALARLYREQGDIGRAIRMHQNLLLRSGLSKTQKNEALLELARDFDAGGFSERAVAGYEEVLDANPRDAEATERLVSLLGALREHSRALALVKRLRRFDREAADAHEGALLLAQARAQTDEGDADGARATLKRALRRDKTNAAAWSMLGDREAERGKDARAIDAWRKAVAADRSLGALLLPRIEAGFAARKKPQDYETYVRSLLEERPTDAAAQVALARTLASRGETREAIESLSRAVEIAPEAPALRVELGRLLLEEGHDGEALKAYGALLDAVERDGLRGSGLAGEAGEAGEEDAS
ncbi:MAG: tetratricopeptide repeat protein [Myxococcota bacterium]